MSPEIDALDRALARTGRDLIIRRRVGTSDSFVQVGFRGQVRDYEPHEISGSVIQGDSKIIASPTGFRTASFGTAGGRQWPRKGDEVLVDGRTARIEACNPVIVGLAVVRLELQVRG